MRLRTTIRGSILALTLALATGVAPAAADEAARLPALTITLAPRPGRDGAMATVDVLLRFEGIAGLPGRPLLALPLVTSNVDTVATVIGTPRLRDRDGNIRVTARHGAAATAAAGDMETGGPGLSWTPARATHGAIEVRYTIPADATLPPRGPAPPLEFRNDGGGVSAAGHVFVLLPPGEASYRYTVAWDLSAMPRGTRGVSSLGEGRVTAATPLTAGQIGMGYFMAGAIGTYPAIVPANGFFGAWQGRPAFDAPALLRWAGELHARYATLFGQANPPPYGVFLRRNRINPGGGVGLYHSFVATFGAGEGSDPVHMRFLLAHEMFHTFQPFVTRPAGLESSWFGEGLATFYQSRLPLRWGMVTPDAFLKDVNFFAARYYTSVMATVPNAQVPARFWSDTRIRTLPYDRGTLYFTGVDAAVRRASGGRRSLDDLMLAMLAREKAGHATGNEDWEALVRAELGPPGVDAFRAFLAGRIAVPDSDALGPCFRRTTRPMRRYDLGFEPAVLAEPVRVVRGLRPGSAAALAGLRDGDRIVDPVGQDAIQGDQTRLLTLAIDRGGRRTAVTYLPRGETVDAWQWERVPGVPDAACRG